MLSHKDPVASPRIVPDQFWTGPLMPNGHPDRDHANCGRLFDSQPNWPRLAEDCRDSADGDSLAAGGERQRKPTRDCRIMSYFDVRDAVLASVSCASLSYASAAPVMVALAIRSTVLSAVERISLERERQ